MLDKMTHLKQLEAESIHIIREVAAEFDNPVMLYSIGKDSAVMLHLVTQQQPDIPVVLTDTGYLFAETYQFIDQLTQQLQLNRSLKKYLKKQQYHFSCNKAFADVVRLCAAPRASQQGTWIVPQMQAAYLALHQAGVAQSVEVWRGHELVWDSHGMAALVVLR